MKTKLGMWEKRFLFLLLTMFAIAVAFNLNGSSIGMWNRYVPNSRAIAPLVGDARAIRSDEWAVFTPMTLAQVHARPSFPYFNDLPRAMPTDMFSVYAQPVRHPLLVFRPFLAGFVLFGFNRGLAFFWAGRWLALLLAMYALFKFLTNGDKPLAGCAALMVVLSPVVQWWGAINALAEILIFGSMFVLCLDRFMTGRNLRERWLPVVGMGYSGIGYAMTLYPAAMVSFAYVFAFLCLWTVMRRANGFRLDKRSALFAVLAAAVSIGILVWYVGLSADAFRTLPETEYPGRRFDCGGGYRKGFGLSFGALFFPWTSPFLEATNVFERATFLDFFPLGVVLAAFAIFRRRICDGLLILLLLLSVLLGWYCVCGFSHRIAALSLLSRSIVERATVPLTFVQFLLVVRSVALLRPSPSLRSAVLSALVFSCVACALAHLAYPVYLTPPRLAVVWIVGFAGCVMFLRFHARPLAACAFFAALAFSAGGFVNPVQCGDAGVLDSDLARSIRAVVEKDDGVWVVEGASFPMNQYPLLMGAKTLNAGNLYPALERWRALDPTGEAKQAWNRYAVGIRFDVRPGAATSIFPERSQTFRVECAPEQLRNLGVRYVLSRRDLTSLSDGAVWFVPEAAADGWTVYSVSAVK